MTAQIWNPVTVEQVPDDIVSVASELSRRLPQRIILFGSRAYDQPHEDSDIDLLIVTAHIPDRRARSQLEQDVHARQPLQLMFMRPDEFDETKDVVGGIAYPAHHWGKVVYVQST